MTLLLVDSHRPTTYRHVSKGWLTSPDNKMYLGGLQIIIRGRVAYGLSQVK